MLEIKNLKKSFNDTKVLDDVSFIVGDGDICGFIGDNGAGKTTTIRSIFREINLDAGEILYNKEPLVSKRLRKISFFPDTNNIPLNISIKGYARYIALINEIPINEFNDNLNRLIDIFDLKKHQNKKIKELSGGLKKRAIMVGALVTKPEMLILDEPTANLDVSTRVEFLDVLRLLRDLHTTILITSHEIEEMENLINHAVIIKEGKIVYDQPFDFHHEHLNDIYRPFQSEKKTNFDKIKQMYGEK